MRTNGGKAGSAKLRAMRREQRRDIEHALDLWFDWPKSLEDLCELMEWHLRFVLGQRSPVAVQPLYGFHTPVEVFDRRANLNPDTIAVLHELIACNAQGFFTTNSQDGQFRAGVGHSGPYEERQRAYVHGFMHADTLRKLRNPPEGIAVASAPADGPASTKKGSNRITVTISRKPGQRWMGETALPALPTGEARQWLPHIRKEAGEDLMTTMEVSVMDDVWERQILFPWVVRALARSR